MERKIRFSIGEYYHIYNRGVEKRDIFLEEKDRQRFIKMLWLANGTKSVIFRLIQGLPLYEIFKADMGEKRIAIGAYVLMPNHFHILVKEVLDGGLTSFMTKLTTGYAMYFNKKYERVGPLFQGTFKAEHVDNDDYLKYLFAYIHLNPTKLIEPNWRKNDVLNSKHVKEFLKNYRHSSYQDYSGMKRAEGAILSPKAFPKYFCDISAFVDFHKELLEIKNQKEPVQG